MGRFMEQKRDPMASRTTITQKALNDYRYGWDMLGLVIWVNYNDLTATEPWNDGIFWGGLLPRSPNLSG